VNPAAVAAAPVVAPTAAIQSVLARYAAAFSALDARSAKAVWPRVNERELARAFSSLQEQHVELGTCDIRVSGPSAVAACEGTTRYTPKVGSKRVRSDARRWTFHLEQSGSAWSIEDVDTR
jgi:hypothetical protein